MWEEQQETVQQVLVGCKMLASSKYLTRHNRTLMVMVVALAKEQNLLNQNGKRHQKMWNRGHVLENSHAKSTI